MRQRKAAKWFQWRPSFWNIRCANMAKTTSDTHSWITLSCTKENGPPFPTKPIRFAGTWQQYSKKAISHENAITPISGQLDETPVCCNFKWPYQANVMKTLLSMRSRRVYIPFMLDAVEYELNERIYWVFVFCVHFLSIAVGDDHAASHCAVTK